MSEETTKPLRGLNASIRTPEMEMAELGAAVPEALQLPQVLAKLSLVAAFGLLDCGTAALLAGPGRCLRQ